MVRRPSSGVSAVAVVALAFFTDTVLYYLLVPLLPGYSREFGLSQMEVSVLFAAYSVALFAGTFPLGKLADRTGRRKPMLWGLGGLVATTVVFALVRSYPLLVLARALQGLSAAATWTAGLALLADHFPGERRGQAMGTAFAAANLGVLLGPPLSGFVAEGFGPRAPFYAAAALAFLDALGRAFLLTDAPRAAGPPLGYAALLRVRAIRVFTGAAVLGSAVFALLESTLPLDLDARLHLGPGKIGLLFAGTALTHTLTSPLMGRLSDRIGRGKVVLCGLLLAGLVLPLPAVFGAVPLVLAALLVLGSAGSLVLAPISPALADAVDRTGGGSYASVFSIFNVAYAAGMMLGPLLGGAAASLLGLRTALVLCGALLALYAVVLARLPEGS